MFLFAVMLGFDKGTRKAAIHMVSAWACQNGIVLGQQKTDSKSNEITAIPELLNILALKGCIVTIDAMGCQRDIAKKILTSEADYVLALKGNQGQLHELVDDFFTTALAKGFAGIDYSSCEDKYAYGQTQAC